MGLIWLIAGIAAVATAFLLPSGNDIWVSLNAAGITAGLYLAVLIAFTTRKPFPRWSKAAAWLGALLTGGAMFLTWTGFSDEAHAHKEWLVHVKGSIGRNVILEESRSALLRVMKSYYEQPPGDRKSLGRLFRESYPAASPGGNIHVPFFPEDSLRIFVGAMTDTEIVLVGQEMRVHGRNPAFVNFNGRIGMVQQRAVLTEEGVRYESEN